MIKLAPRNNVAANNIDYWNRLNVGGFWLITALPVAPFGDCEGGKMTSETDLATAVATKLVKQVPIKEVYKDGLSPAVRETGSVLADFVKTIRLALAPLQFTAALQDRYVRFLDRSVRQIPEDRRILPAPQIVGPILEAIKYEPEDTLISNMYNEVLSRAFDRDRAEDAHPAYAPLIKQLSVDEAIILKIIYEKYLQNDHYKFQCTDDYDAKTNRFSNRKVELDELPLNDLVNILLLWFAVKDAARHASDRDD
jgi:Abortive infection alpha